MFVLVGKGGHSKVEVGDLGKDSLLFQYVFVTEAVLGDLQKEVVDGWRVDLLVLGAGETSRLLHPHR